MSVARFVWILSLLLSCFMATGVKARAAPTSDVFPEMFEVSVNKPVRVIPENATCGNSGTKTIVRAGRSLECVNSCSRQHHQKFQEDIIIKSPGLTFGSKPCKPLKADFGDYDHLPWLRNGTSKQQVCHLHLNKYISYEEETYIMRFGTSQREGSLLDLGIWRAEILENRLIVYVNGSTSAAWDMNVDLSTFTLSQLAFQAHHRLGRLSVFVNGKFHPPEIQITKSEDWTVKYLGVNLPGSSLKAGYQSSLKIDSLSRYRGILTNREIEADHTSVLPKVLPLSHCLCPAIAPAVIASDPHFCTDNSGSRKVSRLPDTFFPANLLTDGKTDTTWVSTPGHDSQITLQITFDEPVAVAAVNLKAWSASTTGFSVSLYRDNEWANVHHSINNCSVDKRREDTHQVIGSSIVPCRTMESITMHDTPSSPVEYQVDLLEGHLDWTQSGDSLTENLEERLTASAVRVTLHGLSHDRTELLIEHQYHALSELQVFAIPLGALQIRHRRAVDVTASENVTDCSECYAGGTKDCDPQTGCDCRPGAGYPSKGGGTCSPYIEEGGCTPDYGPEAGGTELLIAGGYLGNTSVEAVYLGDTDDDIKMILIDKPYSEPSKEYFKQKWGVDLSTDTLIHCITPELNSSHDLVNMSMPLTIHLADGTIFNSSGKAYFTYKPNPVIESITPRATFLRGGINQTITGRHLDSTYTSSMTIFANHSGKTYEGTNPLTDRIHNRCAPCVCDVEDGGRKMVCLTPQFILTTLPFDAQHRYDNLNIMTSFYVGFQMDGVQTYLEPDPMRNIGMFRDPVVHPFKEGKTDSIHVYRTYGDKKDSTLEISGDGLIYGCEAKDYNISIGVESCTLIAERLVDNHMICIPPKKEPKPWTHQKNGHPRVSVSIGSNDLSYSLGFVEYRDSPLEEPGVLNSIIGGAIALVVLIAIIIAVVFIWRKIHRKRPIEDPQNLLRPSNIYERGDRAVYRSLFRSLREDLRAEVEACMLTPESLELGAEVGKGQFGTVYRGTVTMKEDMQPMIVAVKTVKDENAFFSDVAEFLEEATRMHGFKHENVLQLVGVVIDNNVPYIILPFMDNGSLKGYVSNANNNFSVKNLLDQAHQVAKGMAYLNDQHCIHRDLAARNCMVDKEFVVKVADFGLSRDAYEKDYYSAQNKHRFLPVKWMAIECLETSRFTMKSDVWSFGILMWELFTRCEIKPYPDVDSFDLRRYLLSGKRMDQPSSCPDEIYEVMYKCWSHDPEGRPAFRQLVSRLGDVLGQAKPSRRSTYRKRGVQNDYMNIAVATLQGHQELDGTVGEATGYSQPTASATTNPFPPAGGHSPPTNAEQIALDVPNGAASASNGYDGYDNQRTSRPSFNR